MKRYYRKKNKKKTPKKQSLLDVVSPIILICFVCFLILSLLTGFNTLAIIFLAFIFALIPNAYSLYQTYKRRKKYMNMEMPEIDNLTGFEFEELLSTYYKQIGYKVIDTPKSNDYGADLILEKNNRRYVLQAKRYKKAVGVSAIQEVVASKPYYKADGAIVATNNYFTRNAWELAKANHVFLIDRSKLIELKEEIEITKANKK